MDQLGTIETNQKYRIIRSTKYIVGAAGTPGEKGDKGDTGLTGAQGPQGNPGKEVELQKGTTHIQWKYDSDETWTDLIAIADLVGATGPQGATGEQGPTGATGAAGTNGTDGEDGTEIELQKTDTYVQWRYVGGEWTNLIAIADITGPQGIQGEQGIQGIQGEQGETGATGATGVKGDKGDKGDTGVGITEQSVGFTLTGGTTPKTLTVASDANVSGTNTGDQTLPVKATGAEVDTGTDDAKFVTPKAMEDSSYIKSTGNAATATALATARAINGVNFDGSAAITIYDLILTAAPSSDHTATGIKVTLTANENQAFGDVCYINADGQAQLGDADAIATSSVVAMCADASISADASGSYLLFGIARDDTWAWTVGGLIYLTVTGTTGNTLSQTAPTGTDDVIQIMGVATHADRMYFNPQLVQVEHA